MVDSNILVGMKFITAAWAFFLVSTSCFAAEPFQGKITMRITSNGKSQDMVYAVKGSHMRVEMAMDGKTISVDLCPGEAVAEMQRGFAIGDNLRTQLRQRDELLNEARDIERAAASLPKTSAERRKLEDEAAGKRFDARQHENEVEALRGIVAVERWR